MRRICSPASAKLVLPLLFLLSAASVAESEAAPRFVGTGQSPDELLAVIGSARSRSFKPVGHTSVVLRMRTVARVTAAMKVRSRAVPRGYQYEIAAYRISRLLQLDNVPPAIYRRVRWREIRQRFHEEMLGRRGSVRRKILWDDDESAPGAAIYWVKGMRSVGLEDVPSWAAWVGHGEIPEGRRVLARDLSTMAVFDMLIGNWDRFSGGNFPTDASRTRALLRDNDRGFSTPLLQGRYEKLLSRLSATERFSRSLVDRLTQLDEAAIRNELARDPGDAVEPLLSDRQINDVLARKATILSHIAALVEERGVDEVLVFP